MTSAKVLSREVFHLGFPFLEKNRGVLGLRFPGAAACSLLQGWPPASWPAHSQQPILNYNSQWPPFTGPFKEGFPAASWAKSPAPGRGSLGFLEPSAHPGPCHVTRPRQLARRKWRRAVAKGGEATGGRTLKGAERGPGAEQPGNGGGARIPRWVSACCWPVSQQAVAGTRGVMGMGTEKRKLRLPRSAGP